jgi:hypothetical protein
MNRPIVVDVADHFVNFEGRRIPSRKDGLLDLESLDAEQLRRLKQQQTAESHRIRETVDRARREAAQSGQYSDRDWFHRAETALRIRGRQDQQIQSRLRELRVQRRVAPRSAKQPPPPLRLRDIGFADCFIRVAKTKLSKEVFRTWCAEAGDLLDALLAPELAENAPVEDETRT